MQEDLSGTKNYLAALLLTTISFLVCRYYHEVLLLAILFLEVLLKYVEYILQFVRPAGEVAI